MSPSQPSFIKNEEESINSRFVSFKGEFSRYDLAVLSSERFAPDKLVIDLNDNDYVRLNKETLEEEGYLEHALHITELAADDLRRFLRGVI